MLLKPGISLLVSLSRRKNGCSKILKSAVLFPLPQVEGGDTVPSAVNPVGVSVVAILLLHQIYPGDTTGLVIVIPGVNPATTSKHITVVVIAVTPPRHRARSMRSRLPSGGVAVIHPSFGGQIANSIVAISFARCCRRGG